jgi:enoyl-CoA hydratase/carnithine racemase
MIAPTPQPTLKVPPALQRAAFVGRASGAGRGRAGRGRKCVRAGDKMSDLIVVADDGAVRIIRINRPEKKNALTLSMYEEMASALREAHKAEAIRCIMFAGSPGAFCAGNDIADFLNAADGGLDSRTLEFLRALAGSQKPLVAAVGGVAVGIGATMLFHCDHVVAGADAVLSTPFAKLGLVPEAASSLLAPMRMGYARAFAMLVMGRPLSAAAAKDAGIVNDVVASAAVDEVALEAAHEIAALPAGAVAAARTLMRGPLDDVVARIDTEAAHFRERLKSDEARAAFAAFLARKK